MAQTVRVTVDNKIEVLDIPWSLDEWEKAIGAECTEKVHTHIMASLFRDSIVMIVDESGIIKHRPVNRLASELYGVKAHGNWIHGDVLFAKWRGPDIYPLENAEIVKFFLKDNFPYLEEVEK